MAQKIILQKPSRVQQAEDRLQSAVARLEGVIKDNSNSVLAPVERVVALEAELRELKLQNSKLRAVNEEAGSSLDKIIINLKSALKE